MEAHGTGTKVGDPIELDALASVLSESRPPELSPTWVGSVKTNLGHTEAAAGVAGLIKTALMLQQGKIPPSLHFNTPNPEIAWDILPVAIPTALMDWGKAPADRFATVNAFGIAGTNANVVLQGAPSTNASLDSATSDTRAQLLVLSAHTPDALQARIKQIANWMRSGAGADVPIAVTARTTANRREQFRHRVGVVGATRDAISDALHGATVGGATVGAELSPTNKRIGFVFPGQGSQWAGMARALLATEPVFAAAIDECAEVMHELVDWSLRDVLSSESLSDEIDVIQPAIFAMQVGLVALWRSWGVVPTGVAGHSMGEVAAAYVSGALSLKDAALIICVRSRLMRRVRGAGGMAVVELSAADTRTAIERFNERLSVAAENSPRSTVIAGDRDALDELIAELTAREVFAKLVRVDVASHSHQVDALLPELTSELATIRCTNGDVALFSTVRGTAVSGAILDAAYWAQNLRRTVRLTDAIMAMANDGIDMFIEVSPHPVLTTALAETLSVRDDAALVLPSMRRDEDGRTTMLHSLGALYVAGADVSWEAAFAPGRELAPLPTYPFQRGTLLVREFRLTGARCYRQSFADPDVVDAWTRYSCVARRTNQYGVR